MSEGFFNKMGKMFGMSEADKKAHDEAQARRTHTVEKVQATPALDALEVAPADALTSDKKPGDEYPVRPGDRTHRPTERMN